jgi:serine/threonine protein kinase
MATAEDFRTAAASPPRLPERYEPVRLIAAGGTASVWCAEDRMLGRRVAVKLLADPYASEPSSVRRFKREARAAAHLSGHPNVVMIFDVGEVIVPGGLALAQPFLVMEHLAGGTVADALRHGAVTLDDAVRWLLEAASALDYAHANRILHRDIKPANLLLDCDRVLHVADFGIAQIGTDDTLTHPRHVMGTASYLPPERALGRPATEASDLYSLAVAAFEMLTGERPFTASSYVAQARQHLEQPPPRASERNPHLPPAVDEVLARGMAKLPEERWPSAQAFASAVAHALAPVVDVAAGRAAAVERARRSVITARHRDEPRPRRRRRAPFGLLAGAAASLAMVAGGVVWIAETSSPTVAHAGTRPPAARSSHVGTSVFDAHMTGAFKPKSSHDSTGAVASNAPAPAAPAAALSSNTPSPRQSGGDSQPAHPKVGGPPATYVGRQGDGANHSGHDPGNAPGPGAGNPGAQHGHGHGHHTPGGPGDPGGRGNPGGPHGPDNSGGPGNSGGRGAPDNSAGPGSKSPGDQSAPSASA